MHLTRRQAAALLGLVVALLLVAFALGRAGAHPPAPQRELVRDVEREEELTARYMQAWGRVLELESQLATLKASAQTVRVVYRQDGTVRSRTEQNVQVDTRQEQTRSTAGESGQQAASLETAERQADRVRWVDRALPRYRLGADVGAQLRDLRPTVGISGSVRLGSWPAHLTAALVPQRGEFRLGLAGDWR